MKLKLWLILLMKRFPSLHFGAAAMSSRPYLRGTRRSYGGGRETNEHPPRSFSNNRGGFEYNQQFGLQTPSTHHQYPPRPRGGVESRPQPQQYSPWPRGGYESRPQPQQYPPWPRGGSQPQQYGVRAPGGFQSRPQPQQYRPRPTKPLDYRKWEYAKLQPPTHCERFTILSYNILADYLATTHRGKLYYHIPRQFLDWEWRKRSISFELGLWSADILCFQEVDKFRELEELLIPLGYTGIWKMRTGDPVDGCAIFWRPTRFKLVYEESIEFRKYGLRDNVAQICVLESTGCNRNDNESASTTSPRHHKKIVVCNIHVLFNPKRGEIKLGQVRELLHRADAVAKVWDEAPVILCGDFNSTPKSPLYNYIDEQKLDLSELPRDRVSGQSSTYIAPQISPNYHGVHHLTSLAGDSLANSRMEPADVGSPQVADNAGQAKYMMKESTEVSFAGRFVDGNESSGRTLKEEQVCSDEKKRESLCDPADSGQITTVYTERTSAYSASKISTLNPTTEVSEVVEGGSEETELAISVSSKVADKCQELSPAILPQEGSLPNVVLGVHVDGGSLDIAYMLQDGSSNALKSHEVQIDEGEVNDILDDTPVENLEDKGLEKSIYNPSAWTPEEMRSATGNVDCKVVEHPMKLKSTYTEVEDNSGTRDSSGEPLVTSYHRRFQGTVDYIWRSEGLQTVRVLAPIPKSAMEWTPGFPTKKWGSDHIALVSELAFIKDSSAENVAVQ